MSRENVELVRRMYEHFNRRDDDAAWNLIAPDAKFRFIVWGPDGDETYEGRDATTTFWGEVFAVFPDFRMEPEEIVGEGDKVVATIHNTGRGAESGIEIDMRTAVVAEVRDARLVRLEVFPSRAEALEAAGLRE